MFSCFVFVGAQLILSFCFKFFKIIKDCMMWPQEDRQSIVCIYFSSMIILCQDIYPRYSINFSFCTLVLKYQVVFQKCESNHHVVQKENSMESVIVFSLNDFIQTTKRQTYWKMHLSTWVKSLRTLRTILGQFIIYWKTRREARAGFWTVSKVQSFSFSIRPHHKIHHKGH